MDLPIDAYICCYAGFNVETVEYKNISFTVWDVGGQDKVCGLYILYFSPKFFKFFWKNLISC